MTTPEETSPPLDPVELTTPRLHLRPYTLEDAPTLERLAGVREVAATTLSIPHPYPPGGGAEWIGRHEAARREGRGLPFAVIERATGDLVGGIGLTVNAAHARAELGYWIAVPRWGEGFATEAGVAVVDHGFRTLGLHRIDAHHMTGNPASGRVLAKLGMRPEGTLRGHILKWGSFEDIALWGIMRAEWESG
ncbi:MAG: GNAT family N-acetyltransferase [Phycisphaerales bacterium]|nr:GNAT family N-acetyltransferase [Phycisphaerae bacterium]NNF45014.1 GNAT family N-acetyltransferase [Phycisphaerales bacterium]NNM26808.1 GNAT family N-acetyltransferase [Phycisphaerales bacterium]